MKSVKQKDYIWNTIGVFFQNAISPLLLIIVTRINGIDDSGIFSFAFSIAILFWAIAMWGGRTYQVSDITGKFAKKSYISTRVILSVAVIIGALMFCLLNGYDLTKTGVLMSLVMVKVVEAVADAYYGIMQSNKKLYVSGRIMAAKYLLASTIFVLVDLLTKDLLLSCIGFSFVMVFFLLVIDIPYTYKLDSSIKGYLFSKPVAKETISIITVLSPILIVTLLAMLSLNIPRYFLDIHHQSELGYFGILAMPVTLVVLIMSFILQPNVVELAHFYQDKNLKLFKSFILKVCKITLLIGLVLLVLTALIGVPVLNLVFGVSFDGYYIPLLVIVAAATVNGLVGITINILVIMRIFLSQAVILLLTNILLVIFAAITIPDTGLYGAVMLFLGVNIVQLAALAILFKKGIKE